MVSFLHKNSLGAGWRLDFPDNEGISLTPGYLGVLHHTNTAQRLYTFPDKNGTVAFLDDLPDPMDPGMSNPMTSPGDLIVGGTTGAPARLVRGTDGQVLSLAAGTPAWTDLPEPPAPGMSNPMSALGDIIVGAISGAPSRLAKGNDGQLLGLTSGAPTWVDAPIIPDPGIQNPLTSPGDIFVGGVAGAPSRLARGTDGQHLVLTAGTPAWEDQPTIPDPGMANPMTAAGDLIAGGVSGAPARLAKGIDGQALILAAGQPAWTDLPAPPDPGMANPMTTQGDLITGGALGVPARLSKGTEGQTLTIASGVPAWTDPSSSSGVDAAFVVAMAIALG